MTKPLCVNWMALGASESAGVIGLGLAILSHFWDAVYIYAVDGLNLRRSYVRAPFRSAHV